MRVLLIPKYERFDFNQPIKELDHKNVNEVIEEISKYFDEYLGQLNVFAISKSALMGPVGKVLDQAKVKGLDEEFLKGYGISVHKNTIKVPLNSKNLETFENGINLLSQLLQRIPRHMRPKIIEIISYKLYYHREKANVLFWERWREDFKKYLINKYKNINVLLKKCNLSELSAKQELNFEKIVRLPKKLRTKELQSIVNDFNKARREVILDEESEEE